MRSTPSSLGSDQDQATEEKPTTATTSETQQQKTDRINAIIQALDFDRGALRMTAEQEKTAIENAEKAFTEIVADDAFKSQALELAKQLGIYYGYHRRNQKKAQDYFIYYRNELSTTLGLSADLLVYMRAVVYLKHAEKNVRDETAYKQAVEVANLHEPSINEAENAEARQILLDEIKPVLEYAQACMYLGYVGTIQGNYHDERLFVEAAAILQLYENKLIAEGLQPVAATKLYIDKGYVDCFLGLQIHRKSYLLQGNDEEKRMAFLTNAQEYLDAARLSQSLAISINRENPAESWSTAEDYIGIIEATHNYTDLQLLLQAIIELANTNHLRGVVYGKMNYLEEAEEAYQSAMLFEDAYGKLTHREHFLRFVTAQNYSLMLVKNLNRAQEGLELLAKTLSGQMELFKDIKTGRYTDNLDIAKTHHFIGMALMSLQSMKKAISSFNESYDMKIRLGVSPQANEVLESQTLQLTCLLELNKGATFDWNHFQAIKPFEDILPTLIVTTIPLASKILAHKPEQYPQILPLLYQMGAFHLHVSKKPNLAHEYLQTALVYCDNNPVNPELLAWLHNHMAFAFQQELNQAFGMSLEVLRGRYSDYEKDGADKTEMEIRDYFFNKTITHTNAALRFTDESSLIQARVHGFAGLVASYADYERQRVMTDKDDKIAVMIAVLMRMRSSLALYEKQNDLGEQYLRASNRYADLISEYVALLDPAKDAAAIAEWPTPLSIYEMVEEQRIKQNTNTANLWAGRFYYSFGNYLFKKSSIADPQHADYLSDANFACLIKALKKYGEAKTILKAAEGKDDPYVKADLLKVEKLLSQMQAKKTSLALQTGSTTREAGMFGSVRESEEAAKQAADAAAALAAQQSQASVTRPGATNQ